MTGPAEASYDPGEDISKMWSRADDLQKYIEGGGKIHECEIHGRWGLHNLTRHIERLIEKMYRDRAVTFERAAE